MTDTLTPERRSWNMSRIRSKNTRPERIVRSMLHRMGFRFRIHCSHLPGKPDIFLPRYKSVVFVHGCFWHRHQGCKYAYNPKSRKAFWLAKFRENVRRDKAIHHELTSLGWKVITVWECMLKNHTQLKAFLESNLTGVRNGKTSSPR